MQKMLGDKRAGAPTKPATPSAQLLLQCADHAEVEDENILTNEKN